MMTAEQKNDVAVFFDYENIAYSLKNLTGEKVNFEFLMSKCRDYGRVVLANVYADWGENGYLIVPLRSCGFDPIHVTTFAYTPKHGKKTRKNAVDIHMAIDAIDTLHTHPQINAFVLITGDKDFVPVAKMLRKYGKKVYAFGVEATTASQMQQVVDEFVCYADLENEGWQKKNVYEVLVEVVKKLTKEKVRALFPRVKDGLLELIEDFDEKNYKDRNGRPFSRFKEFILEAEDLGYVRFVSRDMVNEVLLPDARVEPLPESPPLMTLEDAFELLSRAVESAVEADKSLRLGAIKTAMRRMHPGFDEKEIKNTNGKYFVNFSDFARAAEKRGLVRLRGKGINLEIQRVKIQPAPEVTPPERVDEHLDTLADEPAAETVSTPESVNGQWNMRDPERVIILDALRGQAGPAPAQVFGLACQQLRDERNGDLPNRRISQLLTEANQAGIIRKSEQSPTDFVFVDDPECVERFLSGRSEG